MSALATGATSHRRPHTKPTVLVDMDGPLAAFEVAFHALCAERGWAMDATLTTQTSRFASHHVIDPADRSAARAHVETEPGWFRELPVEPGAQDGFAALAKRADVWICTKPLEANPTCRDEKAAWLSEHFGREWVHRLIITPDKGMVRGTILLDDAPLMGWLESAEWEPVIYPQPYNGPGTVWDGLRRWTWGDPVSDLLGDG